MNRQISAGAVIFRREGGGVKFLLLYHGKGYWNFPKGRLEKGERAMAAFLREVEEETGLKRGDLKITPDFRATDRYTFFGVPYTAKEHTPQGGGKKAIFKIVIFYLVETRKRDVAVSDEHEGFAWLTYKEAMDMVKYKNTKGILKRANAFIEKNLPRYTKNKTKLGAIKSQ